MTKRKKKLYKDKLIPLIDTAFHFLEDGVTPRFNSLRTSRRQYSHGVQNIIKAILNPNLNKHQQVLALRKASTHIKLALHFKSAGLIDNKEYETLKHMAGQARSLVKHAMDTNKKKGRANDDKRGCVQSLVLGAVTTPPLDNESRGDGLSMKAAVTGPPYHLKSNNLV